MMKTKSLWIAVLASAAVFAQAQAGTVHSGGGGVHAGAVAHAAPAVHAPARAGGFSPMHSTPTRSFGGRMIYPGQRYSSFAMRPSQPAVFRRPNMYPNRVTYTRSGPFTVATIRQPNQINRFPRFANSRNPAATSVWNQRNTGSQLRNGNNHLRETGKNMCSHTVRGTGIGIGTATATIRGTVIGAASLTGHG